MSSSSSAYLPPAIHQFPPQQPVQAQQSSPPSHSIVQQQQQQQSHFFLPASTYAQYQSRQPQLQLEHHYDLVGFEGLGAYVSQQQQINGQGGQQQQAPVVIGVGQGPGNASPKYTARTATALAAHAEPFVFGQQNRGQERSSSHSANGNPEALAGGQETFGASFSFAAASLSGPRTGAGLTEGIPPHEALSLQQQEFLDPHGYVSQQHKRRRADVVPEGYPTGDGSGDEDAEYGQYAYGQYGGYSPNAMSQAGMVVSAPGQLPEQLALGQQVGPGDLGQGVGYGPGSSAGAGAGLEVQRQQVVQDARPKQAACVRCKNLKVRCEFTTDPNTCRRCLNGGHECAIPGRKKRRQPPKREHLLNQIRDQAQQIERLMQQLEEHRKTRTLHNEPVRLSLSNTSLPPQGLTPRPSISETGASTNPVLPRPDVQAWIERARESIHVLGLIDNGAFAEYAEGGEEDEGDGDEGDEAYEGEESYFEESETENREGGASVNSKWREPARDREAGVDEERDTFGGEEPPPFARSPYAQDSVDLDTVRHSSPASTVRTVSREGSAQPQASARTRGQSHGRGGRRKTPQPSRLAPLPTTPAAPFGLIAQLSLTTESHRQGSRSPKSAIITAVASRASSIEVEAAPAGDVESMSPSSAVGTPRSERRARGGGDSESGSEVRVNAESSSEGEVYGAAAPGFFVARRGSVPDPSRLVPARHPVPHILMRGIVTPQEVEILFNIYFDKMNLSCSLLDPVLYTAQKTYWRSPFLFTVICAIASRYYPDHPGLYEELIKYAQLAAGTALISGPKNVETVSAYILLSLYPVPMRRWEEDRTWLYLGLAIRVATDLNLHHPNTARPRNEQHARELLNRTRVWLNCYNLDRSTSSWHGKASTIASRDYTACHSETWYESSEYNLRGFDIQLAGYNAELRLLGEFQQKIYSNPNNPTGLNKDLDLNNLSSEMDEKLVAGEAEWNERLRKKTDPNDPQGRFRNSLIKLAYRYARLIVLSFGFQYAFGKKHSEQTTFFDRCYRAATDVLRVFLDELSTQKVYLRHGPEAQCVFVTFASAFLIKLLHPKYAAFLRIEQRKAIVQLVRGIIDLLSSPEVVVDDKHSPKLWSRFLDGLLATPMAKVELSPNVFKGGNALPRRATRRTTQRANGALDRQGNVSISSSSSSQDALSPATGSSSSSSFTGLEALNASPTDFSGAALSSPPPAVPTVAASGDRYPASRGDNSPPFDFGQGRHQGVFQGAANAMVPQQQQQQQQQYQEQHGMGMYEMPNALQMNVPEFFQPPLPFDSDLLQSMQSMPDTSLWQDIPGFNWMGMLQSADTDTTMQDMLTPGMMNFSLDNPHASVNRY